MKIKVEIDENLTENEIIIKCRRLDDDINNIEKCLKNLKKSNIQIVFYKNEKEFYFSLDEILFFETSDKYISAHTKNDVYEIKYKLYELESFLPKNFIRVSKSTILNINQIYSINHNITSSSTIEFEKSHKQVYVSRFYKKELKNRLKERRNYEK